MSNECRQNDVSLKRAKPVFNISEVPSSKIRRISAAPDALREVHRENSQLLCGAGASPRWLSPPPRGPLFKFQGERQECQFCGFSWRVYDLSWEVRTNGYKGKREKRLGCCQVCYERRQRAPSIGRRVVPRPIERWEKEDGFDCGSVDEWTELEDYSKGESRMCTTAQEKTGRVPELVDERGMGSPTVAEIELKPGESRSYDHEMDCDECIRPEPEAKESESLFIWDPWGWEESFSGAFGELFEDV